MCSTSPDEGADYSASDLLDVLLNHHDQLQIPVLLRLVADADEDLIAEMLDLLAPDGPIRPRARDGWRSDRWVVFDCLLRIAAERELVQVVGRLERFERLDAGNPAVRRTLDHFGRPGNSPDASRGS